MQQSPHSCIGTHDWYHPQKSAASKKGFEFRRARLELHLVCFVSERGMLPLMLDYTNMNIYLLVPAASA